MKTPFGVLLLSLYYAVIGIAMLLLGINIFFAPFYLGLKLTGLIFVVLGSISLAVGYGLYHLRKWALNTIVALILIGVVASVFIVGVTYNTIVFPSLMVNLIVLIYLYTVRKKFQ